MVCLLFLLFFAKLVSFVSFHSASAQYFETTPAGDWSYLGYLETMKPYFYDYATIFSLKSTWRKRFLANVRVFETCRDQEKREVAISLINEVRKHFCFCLPDTNSKIYEALGR
jgi:hypothetical protein